MGMHRPLERGLFWAPRILALLFALFLALFALDAFDGTAAPLADATGAFLMHLAPSAFVLALLVLAWRHELVGGLGFVALGVAYVSLVGGRFDWTASAVIAGPMLLVGVLFLLHRRIEAEVRRKA